MGDSGTGRQRGARPIAVRVLFVLGFVVALGATALVVFGEDVRMLRLAAVLALWAALIAAFAVSRARRDARGAAMRQNEAELTYQLELHREVTARREYEAHLSERVAAAQSDQMAELRAQLERLTGVLSALADGELTVSRLTLSAESARFRPGVAGQPPIAVEGGRLAAVTGAAIGRADFSGDIDGDEAPARAWLGTVDAEDLGDVVGPAARTAPAGAWARRHAEQADTRAAAPTEPAAVPVSTAPASPAPPAPVPAPQAVPVAQSAGRSETAVIPARAPAPAPVPTAPSQAAPAPTAPEEAGEHESGVSVSDLLAAYGLSGRSRRRRGD